MNKQPDETYLWRESEHQEWKNKYALILIHSLSQLQPVIFILTHAYIQIGKMMILRTALHRTCIFIL